MIYSKPRIIDYSIQRCLAPKARGLKRHNGFVGMTVSYYNKKLNVLPTSGLSSVHRVLIYPGKIMNLAVLLSLYIYISPPQTL